MSDYNKTGGPAFPEQKWPGGTGLTKREWYAGQALVALAGTKVSNITSDDAASAIIAKACFLVADAMIREGNK